MDTPLVNIHSQGGTIYLFERLGDELHISEDKSYKQSYYEPDDAGKYTAYDGTRLRKIEVGNPFDVKKYRSNLSYSSDIPFTKNYLIHKVDNIIKSNFKYFFIDIEVYAKEVPNITKGNQPISCISLYNSHTKEIKTWWIMDYSEATILEKEKHLLNDFMTYVVQEKPDIMTGWNYVNFDYPYMAYRWEKVFGKKRSFPEIMSPINMERSGNNDYDVKNPAGVSQLDYLQMFKKVFMREPSYTLDAIAMKYVGDTSWGSSNFGELTQDIKDKNINDIVRLVKLEDKFKLFGYFDEIRLLTKTEWEDLLHNSFIVENLLMQKARKLNIVLPNRPKKTEDDDEPNFQGAAREAYKTGALFDIGKFDLGSAYPNMMTNFCLDSSNIVDDDSGLLLNGFRFQQNPNALIPSMIRDILHLKDALKAELKTKQAKTQEYETLKIKYDAIKGVVNSGFGAIGFSSFRLYDERVAGTITSLVRDVLEYTRDKVKINFNTDIVYWDTDSVFVDGKSDISKELNQYIQDWAQSKGKAYINLSYEYEGYFEKIFIIALCRYIGYLRTSKGLITEIKGAEAKRADSTAFQKEFQPKLIDKILNKESKDSIIQWINKEKVNIKKQPIEYISMPCKLPSKEYNKVSKTGKKLLPIFVRAINNTNSVKKLDCPVGEVLWWNYVEARQKDIDGKDMDVFAFTKEDKTVISRYKLDWERVIERNIISKATAIFEANNWSTFEFTSSEQMQLL